MFSTNDAIVDDDLIGVTIYILVRDHIILLVADKRKTQLPTKNANRKNHFRRRGSAVYCICLANAALTSKKLSTTWGANGDDDDRKGGVSDNI